MTTAVVAYTLGAVITAIIVLADLLWYWEAYHERDVSWTFLGASMLVVLLWPIALAVLFILRLQR